MQRVLYSLLLYLAIPVILMRLLFRSLRAPNYLRRWAQRFGWFTPPPSFDPSLQTIWIHAVSVGETIAAAPMVRQLQRRHPQIQILLTSMTPTGSDRVVELFGETVLHSYIPYDLPGALNRFISRLNPTLLILMETELWPNTIHYCHKRGVNLLLANGRLSERSARGYGRFPALTKDMLEKIDCIAAQASSDATRFIALGARENRVSVTGSLKFNVESEALEDSETSLFESIKVSGRTVMIAASTRDKEEEKVLTAFEQCCEQDSELLLLLVPRHPERFGRVVKLCKERGFKTARRSQSKNLDQSTQILIGDSMGEMMNYYRLADIAFVGGSLVDTGCQNVLEPAALGIPVITGPSQYNFAAICSQLEQAGGLRTISDERELADFVIQLLRDPGLRQQMGARGKELIEANQNALPAVLEIIDRFVKTQ